MNELLSGHIGSLISSTLLMVRRRLLQYVFVALCLLLCVELGAQLAYNFIVQPSLDLQRAHAGHYFQYSKNAKLTYELAAGFRYRTEDRDLSINVEGLRGPEREAVKQGVRLAVLGDSVTFGIGHAEESTLPRLLGSGLTARCAKPIELLNLGVPGYGTEELREYLEVKAPPLGLDGIIYVLNLNDFSRRDTRYEGADNGLYRMYRPPTLKLPFFARKAYYRWHKGATEHGMSPPTLEWYRWMMRGTFDVSMADIRHMAAWLGDRNIKFAVWILPSGRALTDEGNLLSNEHRRIVDSLRAAGIHVFDGAERLRKAKLFDATDHLTREGNAVAAEDIAHLFGQTFTGLANAAECRPQ